MTLVRRYEIAEESMAPTLLPGDYVVAKQVRSNIDRGSIVVFEHQDLVGYELVKRVIALEGEKVLAVNGRVDIDGAPDIDTWAQDRSNWSGEWTVPQGSVFVLGDRRLHSQGDSREVGPIPLVDLHRVVFRYWPARRIAWF